VYVVGMIDKIPSRQRELFDAIHSEYASHYYDAYATAYRERFLHSALFSGLDLGGKYVAEIMCGDGPLTAHILGSFEFAINDGYEISPIACDAYTEKTGRPAQALDITVNPLPANNYDVIAVSGGLHHVAHHLTATFDNIHRALKPSGLLVAFEPNSRYALNAVRKLWYRVDRYFDQENEAALDAVAITEMVADKFELQDVTYGGGPAFFLVYNSLIFRVPYWMKRVYARPLIQIERIWNSLPTPYPHGYFVARWQKK